MTEKLTLFKFGKFPAYQTYLLAVCTIGGLLVLWALYDAITYPQLLNFGLLALLSAVSAYTSTSISVGSKGGITYHVGSAVALAAVPFYGISAFVLLIAVYNFFLWLFKPRDEVTWKKSWSQLGFNIGMHAIAAVISGASFKATQLLLGDQTIAGTWLPWPIAAIVLDEVNLWLLIGILRLQHGPGFDSLAVWREERWASQLSMLVMMAGGAILSIAIAQHGRLGIIIFFLPTALSAYAFRLYVHRMQLQMDNLEKIVAERTRDLAEVNRQKDAFLAVLTHDMMTPLTSIQLCAEELQDEPEAAVQNPYLAKVLIRSQKTLFNLVRNILDLEKLRSGRVIAIQRTTCDLMQLIIGVTEIIQPEVQAKNIKLTYHTSEDPMWFDVDRQQMERVLLNLASNAVKYTPTNGTIHIETKRDGADVVVEVVDTGYGIPAEELPFIFERFRRVEQLKDKAIGTGLGLAITKALVEEHGGTICVSSVEGKGSNFVVRVPA